MDIWQMKYFIQMYNDRSLSRAAKNLYISQQALSKALRKMENELMVPLFDRMINGIKPTRYGDTLFEKARNIVFEYEDMIKTFQIQSTSENNVISIGAANILYSNKLKKIYLSFQEKHPDMSFELIELNFYSCEHFLEESRISICFSLKPNNRSQFKYIPLVKYNLIILINKKNILSRKFTLNIDDLKNESFIMLPTDSKIRKLLLDYCLQAGFSPNITFASSQLDIITELVDKNKGIAVLPDCNTERILNMSKNINILSLKNCPIKIEAGFIMNKNMKTSPYIQELINHCVKSI